MRHVYRFADRSSVAQERLITAFPTHILSWMVSNLTFAGGDVREARWSGRPHRARERRLAMDRWVQSLLTLEVGIAMIRL